MTPSRILTTSALALAVLAASACSSDDSAGSSDATTAITAPAAVATDAASTGATAVGITQSRFEPIELSIAIGDTVTFTNNDPFAHTVTARDDAAMQFDSGNLGQDATFDVTFDEAGTFAYFCQIHPTMRASIVVG